MSEMKLVMPNRIKVTFSDKKGNAFISVGVEQDIPAGMDAEVVGESLYIKAQSIVKSKLDALPDAPEKTYNKPYQKSYNKPKANGGDKCPHCPDGIMKISKAGKPYCSEKCWLPENAHLRQPQPESDIPF